MAAKPNRNFEDRTKVKESSAAEQALAELAAEDAAELAANEPSEGAVVEHVRRRGRWWIAGTVAGLLFVLWAMPIFIAHSPLRNWMLGSIFSDLNGDIKASSASLGWFSGVTLYNVEISDAAGEPVLSVPQLTGDRSLRGLLMDSSYLGHFRLDKPQIHVHVTEKGSNLEETFAHWLQGDGSLECPDVNLEVVNATVSIHDDSQPEEWKLEEVAAQVELARNWSGPLKVALKGAVPSAGSKSGFSLDLVCEKTAHTDGPPDSTGLAKVKTTSLPLALAHGPLQRFADALLAGWLSCDVKYEWNQTHKSNKALIEGEIDIQDLDLAAAALGADQVRLANLKLPCRVVIEGDRVVIERLACECDLGHAELTGPLVLDNKNSLSAELMAAALRDSYQLNGEIDLAGLAQIMPGTLRLRADTQVTAGQMSVNVAHRSDKDVAAWDGRIEMKNLEAENRGRKIRWKKPVLVTVAARDSETGPVIDKLNWQSSFLEFEAAGTLDYVSGWAVYNLNELRAELGNFIDLGKLEMAGEGWSQASWKRDKDGGFEVEGEFQVRDLSLSAAGSRSWTESNLVITAAMAGSSEGREIRRLETARVQLDSGSDTAEVRLLAPVIDPKAEAEWPIAIIAKGQLATWLPRLEPWFGPLEGLDLAGSADVSASLAASRDKVHVEESSLTLRQLSIVGDTLAIDEPLVELTATGEWDRATSRIMVPSADISSSALAVRARDLRCAWSRGIVRELDGTLAYTGDLTQLMQWMHGSANGPEWLVAGRLEGGVEFARSGAATTAQFDGTIENLLLGDPEGREWTQPRVELSGAGRYDPDADEVKFTKLIVDCEALRGDATGRIGRLATTRDLELSGRLDYDVARLVELVRPYVGEGVEIVAERAPRPFSLAVSLSPEAAPPATETPRVASNRLTRLRPSAPAGRPLAADGAVGWTGADLYGFQVGPAEFRGKLREGLLDIAPLNLTVSDGRLTAAPQMRLWPDPAELTIGKGPLLDHVRINPAMCQQGLKYILPVLADVAQAEGRFSIDMESCNVPLADPARGEMEGRLTINAVEVAAGPLLEEIVFVVDSLRRLATNRTPRSQGDGLSPVKLKRESVVPFQMVNGRIYHRDLELVFDDVTIRTYGSVGIEDQSLAVMAEMPIPAKWISGKAASAALKNQVIRLPIGGTLSQPKIDERALQQAAGQFVRQGAEGMLLEGLNQGLNRFLKPQR